MKVIAWNVNSINQRAEHLQQLLKEENPDIVLLQELKCEEYKFPAVVFDSFGYNYLIKGQKAFNGVALFSKYPFEEKILSLPGYEIDDLDEQARFVEAVIVAENQTWRFISVYVPNGQEIGCDKFIYKLKFLKRLAIHLEKINAYDENIVIGGDFNICNNDIDLYDTEKWQNSICNSQEERDALRKLLSLPFFDSYRALYPTAEKYSWWDYRGNSFNQNKGLRIDYILSNIKATNKLKRADILDSYRKLTKPSDHAPVVAEFSN